MPNTAVVQSASSNHVTFLLTGDGTAVGPTLTNAQILAAMEDGPLKDAWNATHADQAAMRLALLAGGDNCEANIQMVATGADITAEVNQVVCDVDADAVTATKAEINLGMSDTTGQLAYLTLKHRHSMVQ